MNDHHQDIDSIIRLVLAGEADEDEKQIFKVWLNASEANRQTFLILKKVWDNKLQDSELSHTDQLSGLIWKSASTSASNPRKIDKAFPWNSFFKVAAVFVLMAAGFFLYQLNRKSGQEENIDNKVLVVKENPSGQKSKIILPDSTVIWLNAASMLTYYKPFTDSIRSVELKGEAFFEVAENPERPFVVKTGSLLTTALGTSFNISNYDEHHHVRVALITGKVKVENEQSTDQVQYLLPGKGLEFNKETNQYTNITIDSQYVLAWKNGVLLFEDDDFEDFKSKLEKWYGVDIETSGHPPQHWRLKGRYEGVYLDDLLDNIKYNKGFTYKLEGKRLMIKF